MMLVPLLQLEHTHPVAGGPALPSGTSSMFCPFRPDCAGSKPPGPGGSIRGWLDQGGKASYHLAQGQPKTQGDDYSYFQTNVQY